MKTVEELYQDYLDKVGLTDKNMSEIQQVETKRAFFGGAGSMFINMIEDIDDLSEDEAHDAFTSLQKEVLDFFKEEVKNSKK